MDEDQKIPLLFSYYFGDSAASAQRGASRRLKKWSQAFEQWIGECKRDYQKDTVKHVLLAWRRLVRQCGRMPWQVRQEHIEQHATWMEQEGFASSTINASMGFIASFYHWCDQQRVDPACAPGFNPAKDAARMRLVLYGGVTLWSRQELEAFLDLLSRDVSRLGKRDYAFFLARLSLGVPLKSLQHLKWGQVEQEQAGAWVRWRPDGERVRLPDPLWQAVTDYLRASGRLDGMQAGKVVFAPQVQPVTQGSGGKPEDWLEEQPLSSSAILSNLKLYARQVGIAESKLTLVALRWTAIRLRLDQGESLQGMQAFMDTRETVKSTKYRLSRLPELSGESAHDAQAQGTDSQVPVRNTRLLKGGESTTHGFYARKKDMQAVKAVLAENIHGVDEEIICLRRLMRGLLEREGDEARLVEAYSQAAHRLASLVSLNEPVQNGKEAHAVEEFLSFLDDIEARSGRPPISPQIRKNALGNSSDLVEASRLVTEEVATTRLLLRNAYRRAMQTTGTPEYLHLVELYSRGCVRLVRLLKIGGCDENGRLERYIQNRFDEAIRELARERGLDRGA
jgi:site-specific recombinase XerD